MSKRVSVCLSDFVDVGQTLEGKLGGVLGLAVNTGGSADVDALVALLQVLNPT